jgi:hypothetical protein
MDKQEARSRPWLAPSVILAVAIGATIITAVYLPPSPTPASTTSPMTSPITSSTSSSQGAASTSIQPQGGSNPSCIAVVPYDSLQPQFGGCGFYFSVPYNGCCFAQSSPNGTGEINLGWTLIITAKQSTGPSENATFGWDPAGPSTSSGERLPAPVNSTLFNGTLTIQWRLYNSTTPQLYAWMTYSYPGDEQFIANEQNPASCPTAPWPSQVSTFYQPAVQQVEQDPVFAALKGGLCYSYEGNSYGTSPGGNITAFFFDEYNGTIYYPCGTFPARFVVSQIEAGVKYNGNETDGITFAGQENEWPDLNTWSCPGGLLPVRPLSVALVPPFTPAGPTIEVTLSSALDQMPITNLTAVLSLTGRNQSFEFSSVSASSPLLPGSSASQTETIVGPVSVDTNSTYPMTIEGSFQDGRAFSLQVTVQVQAASASGGSPG